jgi:2-polyprenyl-3-methyl-5-hydroxy-6-metoxy-1,4-benzoquinol methylase
MDRPKNMYDEYSTVRRPVHYGDTLMRFFHRRMYEHAARTIPQLAAQEIFEVGGGHGHFAEIVVAKGGRYRGVDANQLIVDNLRAKGFSVELGTVPPLKLAEKTDVVWMSHVLEHATDVLEARAMLADAHESLKPGGFIVVIGPDINSWGHRFWDEWTHGFPTSQVRANAMLLDVGFRIVSSRPHVATVRNPIAGFVLHELFKLFPYRIFDFFTTRIWGRALAYSFRLFFGYRQIYFIGQKASATTS